MASFLFLLLSTAWADPTAFSGTWQGQGTYILEGDMTQCASVTMVFSGNKSTNEFVFESGSRNCDKHSEVFYRVPMTFKDGVIYFGSQASGSYTENTLEAYYRMPDGDSYRNWRMFMRREGNHLMYEESRTMDGEDTPMISFAGMLILQP